jgi:hypothetical protein
LETVRDDSPDDDFSTEFIAGFNPAANAHSPDAHSMLDRITR